MKRILWMTALALGTTIAVQAQTSISCSANFTATQISTPSLQVSVTNTSTFTPATQYVYAYGNVYFGDGTNSGWTIPGYTVTHNYMTAGTYNILLVHTVIDSMTQQVYCVDSISQSITVSQNPAAGNSISGNIHWDQNAIPDSVVFFKVWLIKHDAGANTLTAVDSTTVNPWTGNYVFNAHPSGEYLTKAAPSYGNNPVPSYGFVPTYHDSSLYWSGASIITHYSQTTTGKDIWMQLGTPTSGPGFVGGNISAGAGKGTGTGVAGLLVFLRDNATNKLVASTYTDANGDYSFGTLPTGSYNVYPEEMNYETTPSATLSITSGQVSSTGVDFVQTDDEIKPMGLSINAISKNDGIRIYPNPVTDQLFIDNKNGTFNQVTMVNTLGQVIKKEGIKKGVNKVEISTLGSGIYYVIINGTDGARSMKITKK